MFRTNGISLYVNLDTGLINWAHFNVNIGVQFMQVFTFVNFTLLHYLGPQVDNEPRL